jgi:cleavage stimulation factor subunit 3
MGFVFFFLFFFFFRIDMRSLFEKVLAVMPVEISRGVWDRYVDFEHKMVSNGGDLSTVAKVEARRALAFPEAPYVEMKGLLSVIHRYTFLDLLPPSSIDQAFLEMYAVGTASSRNLRGKQVSASLSGISALEEEIAAEDVVFEGCLTEAELQKYVTYDSNTLLL